MATIQDLALAEKQKVGNLLTELARAQRAGQKAAAEKDEAQSNMIKLRAENSHMAQARGRAVESCYSVPLRCSILITLIPPPTPRTAFVQETVELRTKFRQSLQLLKTFQRAQRATSKQDAGHADGDSVETAVAENSAQPGGATAPQSKQAASIDAEADPRRARARTMERLRSQFPRAAAACESRQQANGTGQGSLDAVQAHEARGVPPKVDSGADAAEGTMDAAVSASTEEPMRMHSLGHALQDGSEAQACAEELAQPDRRLIADVSVRGQHAFSPALPSAATEDDDPSPIPALQHAPRTAAGYVRSGSASPPPPSLRVSFGPRPSDVDVTPVRTGKFAPPPLSGASACGDDESGADTEAESPAADFLAPHLPATTRPMSAWAASAAAPRLALSDDSAVGILLNLSRSVPSSDLPTMAAPRAYAPAHLPAAPCPAPPTSQAATLVDATPSQPLPLPRTVTPPHDAPALRPPPPPRAQRPSPSVAAHSAIAPPGVAADSPPSLCIAPPHSKPPQARSQAPSMGSARPPAAPPPGHPGVVSAAPPPGHPGVVSAAPPPGHPGVVALPPARRALKEPNTCSANASSASVSSTSAWPASACCAGTCSPSPTAAPNPLSYAPSCAAAHAPSFTPTDAARPASTSAVVRGGTGGSGGATSEAAAQVHATDVEPALAKADAAASRALVQPAVLAARVSPAVVARAARAPVLATAVPHRAIGTPDTPSPPGVPGTPSAPWLDHEHGASTVAQAVLGCTADGRGDLDGTGGAGLQLESGMSSAIRDRLQHDRVEWSQRMWLATQETFGMAHEAPHPATDAPPWPSTTLAGPHVSSVMVPPLDAPSAASPPSASRAAVPPRDGACHGTASVSIMAPISVPMTEMGRTGLTAASEAPSGAQPSSPVAALSVSATTDRMPLPSRRTSAPAQPVAAPAPLLASVGCSGSPDDGRRVAVTRAAAHELDSPQLASAATGHRPHGAPSRAGGATLPDIPAGWESPPLMTRASRRTPAPHLGNAAAHAPTASAPPPCPLPPAPPNSRVTCVADLGVSPLCHTDCRGSHSTAPAAYVSTAPAATPAAYVADGVARSEACSPLDYMVADEAPWLGAVPRVGHIVSVDGGMGADDDDMSGLLELVTELETGVIDSAAVGHMGARRLPTAHAVEADARMAPPGAPPACDDGAPDLTDLDALLSDCRAAADAYAQMELSGPLPNLRETSSSATRIGRTAAPGWAKASSGRPPQRHHPRGASCVRSAFFDGSDDCEASGDAFSGDDNEDGSGTDTDALLGLLRGLESAGKLEIREIREASKQAKPGRPLGKPAAGGSSRGVRRPLAQNPPMR